MEGDLSGEEEGGSHLQETGNRKETERTSLGCHKEISALSLFPTFFFAKHSKKKNFLYRNLVQEQPHVGLQPHFIPVTSAKVWHKPCQDVVSSWTPRHPCPGVYNRRNSFLCELIPVNFNDIHSKRG